MAHDESTKNHQGGVADNTTYEKDGRMYETKQAGDGYSAMKLYLEKINPGCQAFFQFPKRDWQASDNVWYENRPLGVNKLGNMMREISQEAQLSRIYTNHSLRATAITQSRFINHSQSEVKQNHTSSITTIEVLAENIFGIPYGTTFHSSDKK